MELNMDSLECVPGTRATETSHINQCDRPFRECPTCLDWFEELLECVADGRVVLESDDEQLELGEWE